METTYDGARFAELQGRLRGMWPAFTVRSREQGDRVVVVLSSVTLPGLPEWAFPVLPAYEERYLFYVMSLAHAPESRVVYLTSQPVNPRLLRYYAGLGPGDADDCLSRLTVLSVGDSSFRPLTEKVLDRPLFVDRVRAAVAGAERAVLLPLVTTPLEAELSCRLGIPLYGPDPRLAWLGTKAGSREAFEAAGVAYARGATVSDEAGVVAAVERLLPGCRSGRFVLKLNEGVSGIGNALVDATAAPDVATAVRDLRLEDDSMAREAYLALLAEQGGVVEDWLAGEEVRSPSVQLRASPFGEVEVLSTHDQILGGRSGLSYVGCRFPADAAYRGLITDAARRIGAVVAERGVVGRFAIDFVVTRDGGEWTAYAIEINLRNGGTTHPAVTLLVLTEAVYDEASGRAVSRGVPKSYVATDHLQRPEYRALTVDDVLDVADHPSVAWDPERERGVAFHMVSAVATVGLLGVTAIGDSAEDAQALYDAVERLLDEAAGVAR